VTILDLSKGPPAQALTAEICVIGSGCGGATAAWDLASKGRDVLVLEEGGDRTGFDLTQRDEMYDQLYMDRGGRATSDLSISVLQGRALGGGGVINASDVVPMHDEVARHWVKKFGLTDFSPEALAPYRDRALADLSANRPETLNANNAILKRGAEALGLEGGVMMHNRVGCAGTGSCLVGCPLNAKRNPRFVAIPGALAAGARFALRARAVKIEGASGELKTIRVRRLDPLGHREVGDVEVRAKIVILAANAVASAQLLLRSGIGNAHVGRNLSLQPQLPITAIFDEPVRFFRGIPQSYAVTAKETVEEDGRGLWGFRIEAISGTPGIVASLLPRLGKEGKDQMAAYARLAASLLLLPDLPRGVVRVDGDDRLRIDYALDDEQRARFREAAKLAARAYLAAGAKSVTLPSSPPVTVRSERDLAALDAVRFLPATTPFLSAHQQGGVRFAGSARDGAASPDGRVYGARDVFVFDSSGYPSSASSHTMTPIIAIAHMLSARLLAEH
jgi:choline dehydrogenase-like flavoprotein